MTEETQTSAGENENATEQHFLERDGEKLEITENFWDKEKNEPDVFAIYKSQMDLRKQVSEDLSPKDGVYQINIPKEYQDKLAPNPDDQLYKDFCQFAKKNHISQEEFDSITAQYYKLMYDNITQTEVDEDTYYKEEVDKLKARYGDKVDQVIARIDNFINNSGITNQKILNEIQFMLTSSEGVETLDYLLSLKGEPMPGIDGAARDGALTLEDLRNLQAKPGYKDDRALQEKVRKGYEALYAGK